MFWRDLKANSRVRQIYGGKGERFRYFLCALIGGCWHEISGGRLVRPIDNWLGMHILLSLVGPKLEVRTKMKEVANY